MSILNMFSKKKKQAKGGEIKVASKKSIMVHVGRTGGPAEEYILNSNKKTVRDALDSAGITKKTAEKIHVNGNPSDLDYELEDGDIVSLVKNVEGGNI